MIRVLFIWIKQLLFSFISFICCLSQELSSALRRKTSSPCLLSIQTEFPTFSRSFVNFLAQKSVTFQLSRQCSKFTSTTAGIFIHCPINLFSPINPIIPSSFHCPSFCGPSLSSPSAALFLSPEVLVPNPKPDKFHLSLPHLLLSSST